MVAARVGQLAALAALAALVVTFGGNAAKAAPDPVACTGYPEPRIQVESQSWWEPQAGPPSHPGTGKQGHIHVGMCFPLYQTISGTTLHLDVTVKLHHMPGSPGRLTIRAYGDVGGPAAPVVPPCPGMDCTYTYGYDFPLSILNYSGWREFHVYLSVWNQDGTQQYSVPRWYVNFDVPKPAAPPGSLGSGVQAFGGDSWYSAISGRYSRVNIARADVPWDEATGALTPLSGVWSPTISWEKYDGFAYIDPSFHATPPSKGTVILEEHVATLGYHSRTLAIDTTRLADGLHRLVIGGGNPTPSGTNTGVLVVPFLVKNRCG